MEFKPEQSNIPPKIQDYIDRHNNGESIDSFGEIPASWKKIILENAQAEPAEESNQEQVSAFAEKAISYVDHILDTDSPETYESITKDLNPYAISLIDAEIRKRHAALQDKDQSTEAPESEPVETGSYQNETATEIEAAFGGLAEGFRSGFERKVSSYVDKIESSEDQKATFDGIVKELPDSFTQAILNELVRRRETKLSLEDEVKETMSRLAEGAGSGLSDSFNEKIQSYVEQIKSGAAYDVVIQGLPKSFIDAIDKGLEKK